MDEDSGTGREHAAGLDGYGGSSYIDATVLRDRDFNTAWHAASDGTLEQRRYYCQNWRADVVAVLSEAGVQDERVAYSAYGVPFGMPAGDTDADGDFDTNDQGAIAFWEMMSTYDVRGDVNLDGSVTSADAAAATTESLGWEVLSGIDSRKGYAGYEHAPELAGTSYHVRYRVLKADLGRWLTRDPEGYSDGMSLYSYVQGMALPAVDPMGLKLCTVVSSSGRIRRTVRCERLELRTLPAPPPALPRPKPSGLGPADCAGGACNYQPGLPDYPMKYPEACQPMYPSDWDGWAPEIREAYCNRMANYWADQYGIARADQCRSAFIDAYVKDCIRDTKWEGNKKSDVYSRSAGNIAFKKCKGSWAPGLPNPPKSWGKCMGDCFTSCMVDSHLYRICGLPAGCLSKCLGAGTSPRACFALCGIKKSLLIPCLTAWAGCFVACLPICGVEGEHAY